MITLWNSIALIVIVSMAVSAFYVYKKINVKKISFKEALDLTNLPIVTFVNNGHKFNFLLDTGSTASHINKILIDKEVISYTPLNSVLDVTGMEGTTRTTNTVNIKLNIRNKVFEDTFLVNDLNSVFATIKKENGVTLHGIIGNTLLDKYNFIVDFKDYIIYSKK